MKSDFQLTVVIPVYNRDEELRRALQSLSQQTSLNFATLVCDDGSESNIVSIVDSFRSKLIVDVLHLSHSGGPSKPRNYGVWHAQTPWISFLDSDDWWFPERIETILKHLPLGFDVFYHRLIVCSGGKYGSRETEYKSIGSSPGRNGMLTTLLRKENPIPLSSAVVKREALIEIGVFDPEMDLIEDYDLWVRLALRGASFGFINQELGIYTVANDNISSFNSNHFCVQSSFFKKTLSSLSGSLKISAKSYFSYLLCSYSLYLGEPVCVDALRGISFLIDPWRWVKIRIKIIMNYLFTPRYQ